MTIVAMMAALLILGLILLTGMIWTAGKCGKRLIASLLIILERWIPFLFFSFLLLYVIAISSGMVEPCFGFLEHAIVYELGFLLIVAAMLPKRSARSYLGPASFLMPVLHRPVLMLSGIFLAAYFISAKPDPFSMDSMISFAVVLTQAFGFFIVRRAKPDFQMPETLPLLLYFSLVSVLILEAYVLTSFVPSGLEETLRAPFAVLAVILILYPILFASFRLERYFGFKGSRGRDVRIARGILGAFLLVCTLIIMVPTFSNIEDVFGSVAEQNRMKFAFVFCFVAMMFTIPDALLVERDLKLKGK